MPASEMCLHISDSILRPARVPNNRESRRHACRQIAGAICLCEPVTCSFYPTCVSSVFSQFGAAAERRCLCMQPPEVRRQERVSKVLFTRFFLNVPLLKVTLSEFSSGKLRHVASDAVSPSGGASAQGCFFHRCFDTMTSPLLSELSGFFSGFSGTCLDASDLFLSGPG